MEDQQYYEFGRSEMLVYIPKTAKTFLEVGCGGGKFGEQLIKNGQAEIVYGIEPVADACERAKKRLTNCFQTIFADGHLPEEVLQKKYDCIVFNDVLEHLEDPWEALNLCKKLLAPGGCIVASIPNILHFHDFFGMFFSQDFKYREGGIFDKTHLRFFTRKSIVRMFDECGYNLAAIEGIHPTRSKKFLLWNLFTFGTYKDMRYLQFGICAKLKA
jgi:2-polyprenyl-3-methyl-5-hydroxy-6-metoxy-1,4-benzoquinol methylase